MLSARNSWKWRALWATALVMLSGALAFADPTNDPAKEDSPLGSFMAKEVAPGENIFQISAKRLFGTQKTPANLKSQAIGTYALGCLAGAQVLPITGDTWQVMRLSRNRNWGTPQIVSFLEHISAVAKAKAGWNGLLVGDLAQPRGGPMLSGHESHQSGLDADIWFTPMPDRVLSVAERENMVPLEMVQNHTTLNNDTWSESRDKLIQTVAQDPQVARIFVHPPIKKELCRWAGNKGAWLAKVRPLYGHTFHFHVRMRCPAGMTACENQWEPHPDDGTGCGKELAYWYSDAPWKPHKPNPNAPKPKPRPPLTLAGLPALCRAVVAAP